MPTGDFVVCVICGRSYTWMGYFGACPFCNENLQNQPLWPPNTYFTFKDPQVTQRKYLPTVSELIDRLTIVQQKELKIPQNREEYTQEIQDLLHDIKICLEDSGLNMPIEFTQVIRDIIVLALMNCEIWHNESNFRKGIKTGNNLELTHGLNGIRNTAKNKIQEQFGGRKDYKVDNVEAHKEWIPSGYEKKEEDK